MMTSNGLAASQMAFQALPLTTMQPARTIAQPPIVNGGMATFAGSVTTTAAQPTVVQASQVGYAQSARVIQATAKSSSQAAMATTTFASVIQAPQVSAVQIAAQPIAAQTNFRELPEDRIRRLPAVYKGEAPSPMTADLTAPAPDQNVEAPQYAEAPVEAPPQRGSEGMGLPEAMSDKTIATIKATAAVVAPNALAITSNFYQKVLTKMPQLLSLFNRANQIPDHQGAQPRALAAAVVAYASNIDNLAPLVVPGGPVEIITHKHAGLNIQPEHYPVVHDNLMESIGEVLGDAVTADIAEGWSEAVLFLAKVMIDAEEGLYSAAEARLGGWRGPQPFVVQAIEDLTDNVKRFTFYNPDYDGGFDVTPGQFLTLSVDPNGDGLTAPRHYTITSMAGDPYLQCTIKKLEGGVVSTFMHESVQVNDVVNLSPPFGVFTPAENDETAVLISAGIGVTPMFSFGQHFGTDRVALLAHVDRTPASHPGLDFFEQFPCPKIFCYTAETGRPLAADLAAAIVQEVGASHGFYLCGGGVFMDQMSAALKDLGATSVHSEAFTPQLGGCPMRK